MKKNTSEQLVPRDLILKSDKILFITHLAIGDFTYMQSFFKAFHEEYPHIKIDLWIDETRRTRLFWHWKNLKNYSLIDWIKGCSIFNKIYFRFYSWNKFYKGVEEAKKERYPIVVSLGILRPKFYSWLAREISPNSFVASVVNDNLKKKHFSRINAFVNIDEINKVERHVTDDYEKFFYRFLGVKFDEENRRPFINIPKEWLSYAKLKFVKWGIRHKDERIDQVFFINIFAKESKRCWPLDKLVKLIFELKKIDDFCDSYFIVNVEPRYYQQVNSFLSNYCLNKVFLFTAKDNFFQLPAIISLCDFVISVETSTIHISSALNIPVVALMRRKNPEWGPYFKNNSKVILPNYRNDWVEDVSVEKVTAGSEAFFNSFQAR